MMINTREFSKERLWKMLKCQLDKKRCIFYSDISWDIPSTGASVSIRALPFTIMLLAANDMWPWFLKIGKGWNSVSRGVTIHLHCHTE